MAPKVTISPWAKLVRPVVPKMSDRPMAHMAMIRPKRMPSTAEARPVEEAGGPLPPPASPLWSGNSTLRVWPVHMSNVERRAVLVAHRDALGERVEVERDRVGAGAGHRHLEHATPRRS